MDGSTLRACRLRAGWSQERLAEAVGTCREMISDYERGRRRLPEDVRHRCAEVLNAPELVLDELQAVIDADPLLAISWLIEELAEAVEAAREQEARIRRGVPSDELDQQIIWQPRTALATYAVARARQGADVFRAARQHRQYLKDRGYIGRRREAA